MYTRVRFIVQIELIAMQTIMRKGRDLSLLSPENVWLIVNREKNKCR